MVPMTEIPIVMESLATPIMAALPVATPLPSIGIVMASVFTPFVSIPTSFLPLPVVTLVAASPVEIPMLARPIVAAIVIVMTISHGHRRA
jgi:hypothetical protein